MTPLSAVDTALSLVPLMIGLGIYFIYQLNSKELMLSIARMVLQLIAIGYLLTFLFRYDWPLLGIGIMSFMLIVASVITMRPLQQKSRADWLIGLAALGISGLFNLFWMLLMVIGLSPWYQPAVVIPLAGMAFANGMNALSVGGERYQQECKTDNPRPGKTAFNAAMIPHINALMAVGLVSLPGMMTGQILSGVSPLLAVRYQIMVMSMLAGTSIMALGIYFYWQQRRRAQNASI